MSNGRGYSNIPEEASTGNQAESYYSSLSSEKNTSDSADSSSGRDQRGPRRKHSRHDDESSELSDTSSSGDKESATSSDSDQTGNAKQAPRQSTATEQEQSYSRQVKRARGQAKQVSEPSSNPSSSDSQAQQSSSGNNEGSTDSSETDSGKAKASTQAQVTPKADIAGVTTSASSGEPSKAQKENDGASEETPPELRAKREYNRVSAARSRDKRKQALVRLKEHVDSATVEFEELQGTNDALRAEVSQLLRDAQSQVEEDLKETRSGERFQQLSAGGSDGGLSSPPSMAPGLQEPSHSALPFQVQALMSNQASSSMDQNTFLQLLQQMQRQQNS